MYLIKDKMYLNPYRMKDLYNRLFIISYSYYFLHYKQSIMLRDYY